MSFAPGEKNYHTDDKVKAFLHVSVVCVSGHYSGPCPVLVWQLRSWAFPETTHADNSKREKTCEVDHGASEALQSNAA